MGFLDRLTRPGLQLPPDSPGIADLVGGDKYGNDEVFFDNPAQRAQAYAKIASSQVQPSMSDVQDTIPAAPTYQSDAGTGPQTQQSVLSDTIPGSTEVKAPVSLPKFIKPTPQEAEGDNLASPRLTKLGKLMSFLKVAAQGALAGRAASEQAVAQSGGRTNGGFATGAEAAIVQPLDRAGAPEPTRRTEPRTPATEAASSTRAVFVAAPDCEAGRRSRVYSGADRRSECTHEILRGAGEREGDSEPRPADRSSDGSGAAEGRRSSPGQGCSVVARCKDCATPATCGPDES
jgi:hypothetical protein